MTDFTLTPADAQMLRSIMNEVVNAIPDDLLPADLRSADPRGNDLWERLRKASAKSATVELSASDVETALAAISAAISILERDEFGTRTGFEIEDARELAERLGGSNADVKA